MPRKPLEPLMPIDETAVLFTARKGAARMCSVRLKTGGLLVYSPVPDAGPEALDAAERLGGVEAILAPSHFHYLGVPEWSARFPAAELFAPSVAIPRLEKKTTLSFTPMHKVTSLLPEMVTLLDAPGVKAGEAWLLQSGETPTLAVCDAFASAAKPDADPANTPKLRGAFKTMCLGDSAAFVTWAAEVLQRDSPTRLLPAHGGSCQSDGLCQNLCELLKDL